MNAKLLLLNEKSQKIIKTVLGFKYIKKKYL